MFVAFSCLWLGVSMASAQGFFPDEQPSGGGPTRGWGGGAGVNPELYPEISDFNEGIEQGSNNNLHNQAFSTNNSVGFVVVALCQLASGEMCYQPESATAISSISGGIPIQRMGAIGSLTGMIGSIYSNPAASSQTYVADLLYNSNIIAQPAYAQGLGFAALDPVLETWKVFRNLAYLFFVVAFIVIGFLIMFRTKVGQTAITAQQAIPQVVVALVMVTFSYAIAGLLIDLMYLSMYFIVGIFGGDENLLSLNFVQLTMTFVLDSWSSFSAINDAIEATLSSLGGLIAGAFGFIGGIIFLLVISVAILANMFRLFFEMMKSYIAIILSVVFAPMLLMMSAIPGKNVFSGWIWTLIGNLSVFPTVLLVLVVYRVLVDAAGGQGGFIPPYLFGRGSGGTMAVLVGLGMILALPELVKKVKETMGAKDSFGWITSAAQSSLQRGWSGKMPLGLNAKNITKQVALLPVRAGTSYAGYKLGGRVAKDMGMTESQQKNWARYGALTGSIAGPSIIRKAPSVARYAVNQAGQGIFNVANQQIERSTQQRMGRSIDKIYHSAIESVLKSFNILPSRPGAGSKTEYDRTTASEPKGLAKPGLSAEQQKKQDEINKKMGGVVR